MSAPAASGGQGSRQSLSQNVAAAIARYLPIAQWLPRYQRGWLRFDLMAGLTSWGVMVPVALAYAALAGVPPEFGLFTAFTALAAYAVLGTSRHLKVTVSSTMAVMSAAVVADLARGDPATYLALTAALALTVGVILVVAGLARLGFVSAFLSKSVVTGFIFGLAITIIVGQLPKVLGLPGVSGTVPEQLAQLVGSLPYLNPYTLAVGGFSLALILVLRRVSPRIPGPLVALVIGIVAVPLLNLEDRGVTVVGEIATGIPLPSFTPFPVATVPFLVVGAAGIVFIAMGESIGAGRVFAGRHGYEIDPDQELLALGAANLASGSFGGFATDASLSQTATGEAAGGKSQVSSLVTSALILATAIFLAPLFGSLPNAVLGAIVIAGVMGLIDVREMHRYWRWRRTDFAVAVIALVGVVLTTVLVGMVLAVVLSLTFLLYRASRPYVAAIGRVPGHQAGFGDLSRHLDAQPVPGLLIVRLDAPLYFFNANVARSQILELVDIQETKPVAVLIDLAATADLDVTTADMLFDLVAKLRARSIGVLLAQVKGPVRERIRRAGLMGEIGEENIHLSVAAAVAAFERLAGEEGFEPSIP